MNEITIRILLFGSGFFLGILLMYFTHQIKLGEKKIEEKSTLAEEGQGQTLPSPESSKNLEQ